MPARSALHTAFAPSRGLFQQWRVTSSLPSQPLSPIADRTRQRPHRCLSAAQLHIFHSSHSHSSQATHLTNFTMPKRKTANTTTATTKSAAPSRQSKRTKTTTSEPSSSSPKMSPSKTTTKSAIPKAKEVFQPLPPSKSNRLLEPGPILLVSTGSVKDGTHNLMTLGFHSMISHSSPTLVGITLGPWDHSYSLLKKTKECVLCIPNATMAEKVVDIGNISASDLADGENKFGRFGLEVVGGEKVEAGLVGGEGVIGCLECKVEDEGLVGRYNFWVLKVVKGWVNKENFEGNQQGGKGDKGKMLHHRGDGSFLVDGGVVDLRGRMTKWRMLQD
ncbi:hypothetical protein QBC40DRAFT_342879 [Triangularia verruculosa]|uniref:Flavin reductase like domain-containing protein n=1 Tax=Triangularia verruculosa TaxID=2587418 RepID=A0AAN6X909_9PEZI|nr:hypothetical protein QBC40DRAFT_342879 [Triangularia verruculosa]